MLSAAIAGWPLQADLAQASHGRGGDYFSINVQGALRTSAGAPILGTVRVQYSVHSHSTSDDPLYELWRGPEVETTSANGVLTLPADPPATIFTGSETFLQITVNGEKLSRRRFRDVPRAANALSLEGHPSTDFLTFDASGGLSLGGAPIIDATGKWVGDPTGLVGPQGPSGPQGAQGEPGPQGVAGLAGPAASGPRAFDAGPGQRLCRHRDAESRQRPRDRAGRRRVRRPHLRLRREEGGAGRASRDREVRGREVMPRF